MNDKPQERKDDPYARNSFTMRRMADWQLWGITTVVAVILIAFIVWAMM